MTGSNRGIARRSLIAAAPLLSIAGSLPSLAQSPETLSERAHAIGMRFGSAVSAAGLEQARLRALLLSECDVLTPELELKWAAIARTPDQRDYAGADRIAAFARSAGKRLRGHTVLWHRSVPDWVAQRLTTNPDWGIVSDYIRDVATRYPDLIDEWDVVNEPIEMGPRPDGLRANVFLAAFGPDYIARALQTAHDAAPHARLFINEFDLEYVLPEHGARRAALLRLAQNLVANRVPLHGVGIQAHLDIAKGAIAAAELRAFIDALAALGLRVDITELDVKERDLILPVEARDRLVADHTASFLAAVLPHRAVRSLGCWGLSDRQSWLEVTAADRARFPGAWADGSSPGLNRGLPYDANYVPKAMRAAMMAALAPKR